MNKHRKRFIKIKTPVVLYDRSCGAEEINSNDYISNFKEIFSNGKKLSSFHRKKLYSDSDFSDSGESLPPANSRINKSTKSIRTPAIIKKTNVKLEGLKKYSNSVSTYQQILNKIASRLSIFHKDVSNIKHPTRNYSSDLNMRESIVNPVLLKSFDDPYNNFFVMSVPKRKRLIFSENSRKIKNQ